MKVLFKLVRIATIFYLLVEGSVVFSSPTQITHGIQSPAIISSGNVNINYINVDSVHINTSIVQPEQTRLTILTTPQNARVQLNDVLVGITPVFLHGLHVTTYNVKVNLEGFYPFEKDIAMELATPNVIHLNLNPKHNIKLEFIPGYESNSVFDVGPVLENYTYSYHINGGFNFRMLLGYKPFKNLGFNFGINYSPAQRVSHVTLAIKDGLYIPNYFTTDEQSYLEMLSIETNVLYSPSPKIELFTGLILAFPKISITQGSWYTNTHSIRSASISLKKSSGIQFGMTWTYLDYKLGVSYAMFNLQPFLGAEAQPSSTLSRVKYFIQIPLYFQYL